MTSSDDAATTGALRLPARVRRTLRERTERGAPAEVCGVLVGERPVDGSPATDRVTRAVAVENVASTPETRYELDPGAAVDAIEAADARGEAVLGFYHSHPDGPAEPSDADRALATWAGYVYCLVAPDGVSAYRWTGERFARLRVETG